MPNQERERKHHQPNLNDALTAIAQDISVLRSSHLERCLGGGGLRVEELNEVAVRIQRKSLKAAQRFGFTVDTVQSLALDIAQELIVNPK